MINQIYRLTDGTGYDLEIMAFHTNELELHVNILEAGIQVRKRETQIDFNIDESELDSLIDYLQDLQRYIKSYNKEQRSKLVKKQEA